MWVVVFGHFLRSLDYFAFIMMSLAMSFRYMSTYSDYSSSDIYDESGWKVCTMTGVLSVEFASYSLSLMRRQIPECFSVGHTYEMGCW